MTDHDDHSELDQRRLLASAYLDGELSDVERASAEGDVDVMNEVTTLRDVRRRLAVDEAPDAARREAAIAAALATRAQGAPPPPSELARRRARWLAPLAAAAAAVVVIGGVVALRSTDGSDDDTSSADVAAQLEAADEEFSAEGGETAPRDAAPSAVPATGLTEVPLAPEAPADADATEEATAEATQPAGATAELVVIRTADDLLAFAASPPVATDSSGFVPACASGRLVGTAVYLAPEATGRDVEVYVDEENGEVLAVDVGTCEVVLRAASP